MSRDPVQVINENCIHSLSLHRLRCGLQPLQLLESLCCSVKTTVSVKGVTHSTEAVVRRESEWVVAVDDLTPVMA